MDELLAKPDRSPGGDRVFLHGHAGLAFMLGSMFRLAANVTIAGSALALAACAGSGLVLTACGGEEFTLAPPDGGAGTNDAHSQGPGDASTDARADAAEPSGDEVPERPSEAEPVDAPVDSPPSGGGFCGPDPVEE